MGSSSVSVGEPGVIGWLQVAERLYEGSRGPKPTDGGVLGSRRGATLKKPIKWRRFVNRRSATTPVCRPVRGLKPTATFKTSLREEEPTPPRGPPTHARNPYWPWLRCASVTAP